MKLYFVTVNKFKAQEVRSYLKDSRVEVETIGFQIQEILHLELEQIVRDKLLKAYAHLGSPCAVEHGGLLIDALNRLPGGLSKPMWDAVEGQICNFIQRGESRAATAKSVVGYCDGKKVHLFSGETRGIISKVARGAYKFQWDPIFIPNGSTKTYAELGFPRKADYSQAKKAWTLLGAHLRSVPAP